MLIVRHHRVIQSNGFNEEVAIVKVRASIHIHIIYECCYWLCKKLIELYDVAIKHS